MDEIEKQKRITVAVGHFAGWGQSGDQERIKAFLNATAPIPMAIFADACELAVQLDPSSFAPGAGAVIQAALSISPHEHAGDYQGGAPQRPEWHTQMIRGKRARARRRLTSTGGEIPGTCATSVTGEVVAGLVEALSAPKEKK